MYPLTKSKVDRVMTTNSIILRNKTLAIHKTGRRRTKNGRCISAFFLIEIPEKFLYTEISKAG